MNQKIYDAIGRENVNKLNSPSDLKGFYDLIVTWAIIAFSFALVAFHLNIYTILLSLVLLGGRILALNILMHDCSHYSCFKTRWLNDFVGTYFCAAPVIQHLKKYRVHHLAHHKYSISDKDPDLSLIKEFPITFSSFVRKSFRDLIGITGIKRIYATIMMDLGIWKYTVASIIEKESVRQPIINTFFKNTWRFILFHCLFFFIFYLLNFTWLYLLWWAAYMTTFSWFIRIRSISEHACLSFSTDPLLSTRTTKANIIARLTVAPHHVNYHLEHHLMMGTPSYNLPRFHMLLTKNESHLIPKKAFSSGYINNLKICTSKK